MLWKVIGQGVLGAPWWVYADNLRSGCPWKAYQRNAHALFQFPCVSLFVTVLWAVAPHTDIYFSQLWRLESKFKEDLVSDKGLSSHYNGKVYQLSVVVTNPIHESPLS